MPTGRLLTLGFEPRTFWLYEVMEIAARFNGPLGDLIFIKRAEKV